VINASRVLHVRIRAVALLILLSTSVLPRALAADEGPEDVARARGEVVWLDFWASWCGPCRHSFPWMNAMQKKYGPFGLTIIAVNLDSNREDAEHFLASIPAGFKVQFDPEGRLAERYDVEAMPSSYILSRTGKVVERHLGFKESKEMQYEASIREALGLEGGAP